jgi:hypothetical protein
VRKVLSVFAECRQRGVRSVLAAALVVVLLSVALHSVAIAAPMAAVYTITARPSVNPVAVGGFLYFTGTVQLNGKAVKGFNIGVEDPMKQMSLGNAATTDATGTWRYVIDNTYPAVNNCKVGNFRFRFYAGSASVYSSVSVSAKGAWTTKRFTVTNSGTSTYKVQLTADGVNKGTYTVAPGKTIQPWTSTTWAKSTVVANVMSSTGTTLWKGTYTTPLTYSPRTSTFLNPFYANYSYTSNSLSNPGARKSGITVGTIYNNVVNRNVGVGARNVFYSNNVSQGVATQASWGVSAPECTTFLGLKAGCSVGCDVSVGLRLSLDLTAGTVGVTPVSVGCGVTCSVEIATVTCTLGGADISAQATWK